jgi:phage gpG-like protein
MAKGVKDIDHGFDQMVVNVKELKGHGVKVGVMGGGKVLEYAIYNEFGTSRIPARPFMQTTFDNNQGEILKFTEFLAQGIIDGKSTVDRALRVLGETYQLKVQQTIRDAKNWAVPNNPNTIKQKGSSSPLIDEGRLVGSIRYEII